MDKVIELAKRAGAVSYTNRHYPDRPYRTFGPEELQKFYTLARADLEAENAKLERDAAKNESVWMDAKRLAMELECLMHDCDLAAVSKWWDSAHEALELHRQLIQETYTAMEATK